MSAVLDTASIGVLDAISRDVMNAQSKLRCGPLIF